MIHGMQRPKYTIYFHEIGQYSQPLGADDTYPTYLMQKETHEPRRNDGVSNPYVPLHPVLLQPVQRREICASIGRIMEGGNCGNVRRHDGGGRERDVRQ